MKYCLLVVTFLLLSIDGYCNGTRDRELSRIYNLGGRTLVDSSLEVTGAIRADRYYEIIGISTTTITTPSASHARVYLSSSTHQLLIKFDDGTVTVITGSLGDITSVVAGLGLTGGGIAGDVTLYLSTPVAEANLTNTYASSMTFATVGASSEVVTNFTATNGTFTAITAQFLGSTTNNKTVVTSTIAFSPTTLGILGTPTNDNAQGGMYGEYVSSTAVAGLTNCGGTGNFISIATMSVSAGDWSCYGGINQQLNGATETNWSVSISSFSGNTTTDHIEGFNQFRSQGPTANNNVTLGIPNFRMSCASGATCGVYLKMLCTFSAGTPRASGWGYACRRER